MPFDFKKEPLYRAGRQQQIVQVPPCSYLAVRGQDALQDQRPEPSGDLFVERQLALVINRDHNLPFRESVVY